MESNLKGRVHSSLPKNSSASSKSQHLQSYMAKCLAFLLMQAQESEKKQNTVGSYLLPFTLLKLL